MLRSPQVSVLTTLPPIVLDDLGGGFRQRVDLGLSQVLTRQKDMLIERHVALFLLLADRWRRPLRTPLRLSSKIKTGLEGSLPPRTAAHLAENSGKINPPCVSGPRWPTSPRTLGRIGMRAFIFPGRGGQSVGMGVALAGASREARAVFEEVDEALGQNLSRLMAEGPAEELMLTENAPARDHGQCHRHLARLRHRPRRQSRFRRRPQPRRI